MNRIVKIGMDVHSTNYTLCAMEPVLDGEDRADKVYVQLLRTEPGLSQKERVVQEAMKTGLYEAFDLGVAWLERYLRQN